MQNVREIISTLCKHKNVEFVSGALCKDHMEVIWLIDEAVDYSAE